MSHAALSPEEKKEIGISEGLIRISAGLENTDDLTEALKKVLEKLL
jgi:cystathionine beta-lyase/cystathionine gamma-synthase